jgi:hypothetical protein
MSCAEILIFESKQIRQDQLLNLQAKSAVTWQFINVEKIGALSKLLRQQHNLHYC